ncbi:MAG: hypothetical protein ACNS60_07590 [Candidatus Cyclobacteriaceae bacterium M2_1C_046]
MKNTLLYAIPVGIAAVALGCETKNDLTQVKGTIDTLKTEWYVNDSIINSLSVSAKTDVSLFQQNYVSLSTNELVAAITDEKVKTEIDSILNIANTEVKEAEMASAELDSLLKEWTTESEEFVQLIAQVETNDVPADSAIIKVSEFKNYLASAGIKKAKILEVMEDTKKQHELITSEINKKVNPTNN